MPLRKQNVIVEGLVMVPADEDAHPMPPIYLPIEPPLGFWGGVAPPHVDASPPGDQPVVDHELPGPQPRPEHPIYIPAPEPPLGFWGGVAPPHVDASPPGDQPVVDHELPGPQPGPEHPIYIPVPPPPDSGLSPEHPIYIPIAPPPTGIWGDIELPEHPIVIPEPPDREELKQKLVDFLTGNLPPSSLPPLPDTQ